MYKNLTDDVNIAGNSAGDPYSTTHWRTYGGYNSYLLDDQPRYGDPQYGNGLFVSSVRQGEKPRKYFRMVSTESFRRPIKPGHKDLHISGWVRVEDIDLQDISNHGAKLHVCHEDSAANYTIDLLRGNRNVGVYREDRVGTAGTKMIDVASFDWDYGVRYRFDIVMMPAAIEVYMDGTEVLSVVDNSLRAGNVGWRGDRTDFNFGDFAVGYV